MSEINLLRFSEIKKYIWIITMILSMLLYGCTPGAGEVSGIDASKSLRIQKWLEDIDYLHKNLPLKHINAYHSIKKEDFDKEIEDLKNDVPKLEDFDIKCRLAQIVASIGDAHTSLNLSSDNSLSYPLTIRWFGEELRVIAADKAHKAILGKKLTHINDIPINELMRKTDTLISHENGQWLKVKDVQYVVMPGVLKFLGITAEDTAEFTFEDDNNDISKSDLRPQACVPENMVDIIDQMPVKPLRFQYDHNSIADTFYWYRYIPEDKILYFQYNECMDRNLARDSGNVNFEKYPDFKIFSDGLLKVIAENNIDKFVIDLRSNTGGNSTLMSGLADKLAGIENLKGKVFVLIGRETYSSGVIAAVDLLDGTNAIFCGEPTGGNVNGYGDIRGLLLKNSKLQISYATQYFDLSDKYKGNIVPEMEVNETFNSYKKGIDAVYEAIRVSQGSIGNENESSGGGNTGVDLSRFDLSDKEDSESGILIGSTTNRSKQYTRFFFNKFTGVRTIRKFAKNCTVDYESSMESGKLNVVILDSDYNVLKVLNTNKSVSLQLDFADTDEYIFRAVGDEAIKGEVTIQVK
jgi:hypothetical protein